MRTRRSSWRRRKPSRRQSAGRLRTFEVCEKRLVLSVDGLTHVIDWHGISTEAFQGQWILSLDGWEGGLLAQQSTLSRQLETLGRDEDIAVQTHLGRSGLFRIDTASSMSYDDVLASVSVLSGFNYLEPDFALEIQIAPPDDPDFDDLWGLDNTGQNGGTPGADISALEAWDVTTGSSDVIVGVVDTGIEYTHPDLIDNMWINPGEIPDDSIDNDGNGYVDDVYGWDFFFNDDDPMDFRSHGTHVAGTIGAVGNNTVGVTGVNWDVGLMALKISNDNPGSNSVSSAAATAALNYVADMRTTHGHNIRVTNHSWGGGGISTSLQNAIALNETADILLVAAAGNNSRDTDAIPHYPSSYTTPNVISVAATNRNDALSGFSNFGLTSVDLGAPGSSIRSTVINGGYANFNGTSMATPHVAGVAALAWSFRPDATYQEIKDAILAGVDPIPALDGITVTGGRLNAATTLQVLGLNATPISPAAGEIVAAPPLSFTVQFSDDIDLGSLTADDFQVNAIAADSFQVDAPDQITFGFNTSPVTLEGLQTMTMAEGSVLRDSDGFDLNALSETFRYDITTLAVTSIVPNDGSLAVYPVTQIDVTFNEPIDAASLGLDDLVLSEGTVTLAEAVGPSAARYTVSGIETEGDVDVSLTSSSVTDAFGNPMAPFAATFELDVDERALANFLRVEPFGSLVSESVGNFGRFGTAADVDTLTVDLVAGETLLAVVHPNDPLATITAEFEGLTAPVVGSAGASVLVPLTSVADDATVRLRISTDLATDYTYDVYRNALLEPLGAGESFGLAIDASRIEIAGTRYALLATSDPAGTSTDELTIDWSSAAGQQVDILLTGLDGVDLAGQTLELLDPNDQVVATGADLVGGDIHDAHVAILNHTIGTPGLYTVRVTSTLEGRYSLVVTEGTVFATEPNGQSTDPVRSLDSTGSAIGHLGTRLEDGIYSLTIDSLLTGLAASGDVEVAPAPPAPLAEQAAGSLSTSATGTVDVQILNGTLQILDTSSLDLVEQPGPFLPGNAPGDIAAEVDLFPLFLRAAIRNVIGSATTQQVVLDSGNQFDAGGLRILVNQGQFDYEVVGVLNDTYDLNGLVAFSDPGLIGSISPVPGQIVLDVPVVSTIEEEVEIVPGVTVEFSLTLTGSVLATMPFGDAQDIYELTVQAGQVVTVSTTTPLAGGVSQDLDPLLNVYLPDGTLLITEAGSLEGGNARLSFLAPTSGVYQIGVAAESGFGEYELLVDDIQSPLVLAPDAVTPALTNLVWTGTPGADHILFTQIDPTTIQAALLAWNGAAAAGQFSFTGVTGRVIGEALAGSDVIDGSALTTTSAEFRGGLGTDTVLGGAADDLLEGDADGAEGADYIDGGAGDDTIFGDGAEGGDDTIYGGSGNDFIDTGGGNDWADGGEDDDILLGGDDAAHQFDGGEGSSDDTLFGGNGRDILIGDGGLSGLPFEDAGSDLLDGGQGEDLIVAGHYLPGTMADYNTLQQAWLAGDPFADRVAAISGTIFQPGVNLYNDEADPAPTHFVDQVVGGDDLDWLLYDFTQDVDDATATELTHAVDLSLFPRT